MSIIALVAYLPLVEIFIWISVNHLFSNLIDNVENNMNKQVVSNRNLDSKYKGLIDDAAANHHVFIIKDDGLPWSCTYLRHFV